MKFVRFQFVANLKRVKKAMIKWDYYKKIREEHELVEVKSQISSIYAQGLKGNFHGMTRNTLNF